MESYFQYFDLYHVNTIDDVSSGPGIYAWYIKPNFGPKDLEDEEHSAIVLREAYEYFRVPVIGIEAKDSFDSKWTGEMCSNRIDRLKSITSEEIFFEPEDKYSPDYETKRGCLLQKSLKEKEKRKFIGNILNNMNPFFSAPVYIGVAKNLNNRLKTHVNSLNKYNDFAHRTDKKPEDFLKDKKESFAKRAAIHGLNSENLEVWILDFGKLKSTFKDDELRELAQSCEFLLNRLHNPILGRK